MPLILTLLAILANIKGAGGLLLAGMSALGGLIAGYFFLAVASDGSLSTLSGGVVNVLASATSSTSPVWNFVILLPLSLAFFAMMASMYRGWQSI